MTQAKSPRQSPPLFLFLITVIRIPLAVVPLDPQSALPQSPLLILPALRSCNIIIWLITGRIVQSISFPCSRIDSQLPPPNKTQGEYWRTTRHLTFSSLKNLNSAPTGVPIISKSKETRWELYTLLDTAKNHPIYLGQSPLECQAGFWRKYAENMDERSVRPRGDTHVKRQPCAVFTVSIGNHIEKCHDNILARILTTTVPNQMTGDSLIMPILSNPFPVRRISAVPLPRSDGLRVQ